MTIETDPAEHAEAVADLGAIPAEPAVPKKLFRLKRFSKPVTIAVAVGVLGLAVGGGAGYALAPSGSATSVGTSSSPLSLPATLSGGYKRNATVDTQIKAATASAASTLGAGADMALYASGSSQVLVEAARIGGVGALSAGMTYAKVGDAICASTTTSNGSEAICTRTNATLTVKVTATDQATAAKYVDEVYKTVA